MARLVRGSASRFPRGCASPVVARFGIPRESQGFPEGIPGEAVLADSRGPKLLVQLESWSHGVELDLSAPSVQIEDPWQSNTRKSL